MRWLKRLKNRFFRRTTATVTRRRFRLGLESLEDRVVPTVTPVTLPQGTPYVVNVWINDAGQVAGTASSTSGQVLGPSSTNGFVWTAAQGTQTVFAGGQVLGENSAGQVLGIASDGSLNLWDPKTPNITTPVVLPNGDSNLVNAWINNQGQVAGTASSETGTAPPLASDTGFVWTTALGTPQTIFAGGEVLGENNSGQVLGIGSDPLDLWDPNGNTTTAIPLPLGGVSVLNAWVNDQGQVAGTAAAQSGGSLSGSSDNGFVWTAGNGTQTIFAGGQVLGQNNGGQVLGSGSDLLDRWDAKNGSTAIPLPAGSASVVNAWINDQGQVAGTASPATGPSTGSANDNGFVWTQAAGTQTIFAGGQVLGQNNSGQVVGVGNDPLDVWSATVYTNQITFNALPGQTYGVAPITLNATASSGLPVSFTVLSGPATVAGNTLTITGAGSVTVAATQAGDQNYPAATPVDQSFTVSPALLTVTATNLSRLYGQANPTLTYTITGFVNGANATTAGISGTPALSTTATPNSPVGGGPYAINVDVSGMTAANYDFTSVAGQLTVNPAKLTVTADPESRLYGQANPTLTYTINGFVNGEGASSAGISGTPALSTSATNTSAVAGSPYAINVDVSGMTAANYTFAPVAGQLTVNKAHLTVTADPQSRLYGQANPTFTATVSGFVNGEDASSAAISGAPTLSSVGPASPVAGSPYAINADVSGMSAANYDFTGTAGPLTINKAHLTVTADNQARGFGQPDPTFTATITGFQNGETLATSGVSGAPALSSTDNSSSPVGSTYPITVGQGTLAAANYDFPNLVAGTLTIGKQGTTVQVQSSADPASVGVPVTLTANIATSGTTAPTGNVTFYDGNAPLGSVSVQNGVATLPYTFQTLGTHRLSASYGGDADFTGNVSPNYAELVLPATKTTLTLSNATTVFGQPVTFTATVATVPAGRSARFDGTVTFFDGATPIGTKVLTAGNTVTFTTNSATDLVTGTHTLTAVYRNDTAWGPSTSTAATETVNAAKTHVVLGGVQSVTFGKSLTLTARVLPNWPSAIVPTGTVTFTDTSATGATTTLGTVTLSNGVASLPVSGLSVGKNNLAVTFTSATTNDLGSATAVSDMITKAASMVVLAASQNSISVGQAVTFTAKVSSVAGVTPQGTVTFTANGALLGTATVDNNGVARLDASSLAVGGRAIVATYGGDTELTTSSAGMMELVAKISTTVLLGASTSSAVVGQPITLTAQIGLASPGALPTGTVKFLVDGIVLGSANVVNGSATLPVKLWTAGVRKFTAVYSGDGQCQGSPSAVYYETIS